MPRRRRGIIRLGYALAAMVVAASMVIAGTYVAQADTNTSPKQLVVYNNNVENMVPDSCYGYDFNRLLKYIKKQTKSPDVFTVQQVSNSKQLKALTKKLSDELPGTYAGKIAVGDPGSMGHTSKCGKLKNQQTNAVVYRSDRLEHEQSTRWRSDATNSNGKCRNLSPAKQDRVHNIGVRLHDKVAKQDVSVVSIHWPTRKAGGAQCAAENMNEASKALDKLGGTLKIFGGDVNTDPDTNNWWQKADGLNFRDPIAEICKSPNCPARYNTLGKGRIDHILVKSGHGFSNVDNITWKMAGGKYSDHRAITAYVKY